MRFPKTGQRESWMWGEQAERASSFEAVEVEDTKRRTITRTISFSSPPQTKENQSLPHLFISISRRRQWALATGYGSPHGTHTHTLPPTHTSRTPITYTTKTPNITTPPHTLQCLHTPTSHLLPRSDSSRLDLRHRTLSLGFTSRLLRLAQCWGGSSCRLRRRMLCRTRIPQTMAERSP